MSNLSGFVKRLRDIMRNDAGINGDAQRIEQIAWMLFLKVYDAKEHKLFGKGVLLNHSFSTKRRGSIANRLHRMLSGVCPDCGCSRVFSFSHYTTPTKR